MLPDKVIPINLTLLTSKEDITNSIESIRKRSGTLEKDIHTTAVSIVAHVEAHGDVTLANKLIDAIPLLARKNALRAWFEAFGKFKYKPETKELGYDKSKDTLTAEATETPFWEFKTEGEYVAFNLEEAFIKFVYRAMKRAESKDKRDKIKPDLLKKLQLIAGKDE